VREAMANGGIYIVAPADVARELTLETAIGCATEAPAGAECSSGANSSYCSDSATAPICRIKPSWSSMFHD
jgi:hypothetical protein